MSDANRLGIEHREAFGKVRNDHQEISAGVGRKPERTICIGNAFPDFIPIERHKPNPKIPIINTMVANSASKTRFRLPMNRGNRQYHTPKHRGSVNPKHLTRRLKARGCHA